MDLVTGLAGADRFEIDHVALGQFGVQVLLDGVDAGADIAGIAKLLLNLVAGDGVADRGAAFELIGRAVACAEADDNCVHVFTLC